MSRSFRIVIILVCLTLVYTGLSAQKHPVKIACVGGSATFGDQMQRRSRNAYPAQLEAMLGEGYSVANFGVSDSVSKNSSGFENASGVIRGRYDVVFLMPASMHQELNLSALSSIKQFVKSIQSSSLRTRVVLISPPPAWKKDSLVTPDPSTKNQLVPAMQQAAYETGCEFIDFHTMLQDRSDLFPDLVHMSSLGATAIARRLYEVVIMKPEANADVLTRISESKKLSSFYGYDCADFNFAGRSCKVVKPKRVVAGKPWVWRARFWGHEPQTDIALLERGFHIVYCDVAELYGNAEAISIWNGFYNYMQKLGLSKKTVLEGMSRGGVYMYNWALANPGKVACIYADAPVLDLKSWPGGKYKGKGSSTDWETFRKDFNLSEEQADNYKNSPVDRTAEIARLKIPMLHVVGDADDVVPVEENTGRFEAGIRSAGGDITVIHKPGIGHHPHSLANPEPIVNFILQHSGYRTNFAVLPAPGSEYRSGAGWVEGTGWWDNYENINHHLDQRPGLDIIFLGNSITQGIAGHRDNLTYKPGLPIFDSVYKSYSWECAGISGDRTQHLLWRLKNGSYVKSAPSLIVVTIGVNNFADDTPDEVSQGIELIVREIRRSIPTTKILLIGPLPCGLKPADMLRQKYEAVHAKIAAFRKDPFVTYLPLARTFIQADGSLDPALCSGDGIHLVDGGYRAWALAMKPVIDVLLK